MQLFLLTGILAMAAVWDLFYAKIPNGLIAAGLIMAFLFALFGKAGDIPTRFFGMLLPFLTLVVFFAFGILGAGDIKLFCVIGAFLGVKGILHCIGGAFIAGALTGVLKTAAEAQRRRRYPKGVTVRFALPILCGTMWYLLTGP